MFQEQTADLIIVGGGTGGCAAAMAATRLGLRVIMTEETDWVGGQLTSQAVPPDEHPWIENQGCTASYRRFRDLVREHYRRFHPLSASARADNQLNPGGGDVSRLCFEPRVGLAVLESMLAPAVSSGQLTILLHHRPTGAEVQGDRVQAVTMKNILSGEQVVLRAPYFIDATEQGDLLPLTGTEYVTGFESRGETGEPHAPDEAQPDNVQAFTVCFAAEYRQGEDHVIARPEQYDFWREYAPQLQPAWTGPLLSLTMSHPITLKPRLMGFDPEGETPAEQYNLWIYRLISAKKNHENQASAADISLINWPQNDYLPGRLYDVSEAEYAQHLHGGKQLSLSLLYWLQTEAPRRDGGTGWKGLKLRPDIVGTEDGMAKYPYIREGRRIRAEFTVCEQHVATDTRRVLTGKPDTELRAQAFPDSVGVGCYRIDLHPTTGGDNYLDIGTLPFQIPLGALIPRRMENLIAGCKNLGVTHITNGCYRLHPVEWNIGEAAGALAAFCLQRGEPPRHVRNNATLLPAFQAELSKLGFQLGWTGDLHPV